MSLVVWNYANAPLTLPRSERGQPPAATRFGRLEVADVSVTMPDGSKKSVKGRFTVERRDWGGVVVPATETGYGIDLPPGTYSVRVTYTHPIDGTPAGYNEDVTL